MNNVVRSLLVVAMLLVIAQDVRGDTDAAIAGSVMWRDPGVSGIPDMQNLRRYGVLKPLIVKDNDAQAMFELSFLLGLCEKLMGTEREKNGIIYGGLADCNGIPDSEYERRDSYREQAANLGLRDAMNAMSMRVPRDDAIAIMNELWNLGDTRALLNRSNFHWMNYSEGIDTEGNLKSLADRLALVRLDRLFWQSYGLPWSEMEVIGAMIEDNKKGMSEEDIARAEKLATEMILSNPNCCFEMYGEEDRRQIAKTR